MAAIMTMPIPSRTPAKTRSPVPLPSLQRSTIGKTIRRRMIVQMMAKKEYIGRMDSFFRTKWKSSLPDDGGYLFGQASGNPE